MFLFATVDESAFELNENLKNKRKRKIESEKRIGGDANETSKANKKIF